jgi:hypothetical protein
VHGWYKGNKSVQLVISSCGGNPKWSWCGAAHCDSRANIVPYNYPLPPFMAQQHLDSQCLLIIVVSRSHSDRHNSAGLLWTSQADEETSTWQHTHATGVIGICNPGKRAVADPRRPRGHWDRHAQQIPMKITLCWKTAPCIPMYTTLQGVRFQNTANFNSTSREPQISPKLKILILKKHRKVVVQKQSKAFTSIITLKSLRNLSRRNIYSM